MLQIKGTVALLPRALTAGIICKTPRSRFSYRLRPVVGWCLFLFFISLILHSYLPFQTNFVFALIFRHNFFFLTGRGICAKLNGQKGELSYSVLFLLFFCYVVKINQICISKKSFKYASLLPCFLRFFLS